MTIYMIDKDGKRYEGQVRLIDGGRYVVTEMVAPGETGGYSMYPFSFGSLASLLRRVENNGHHLDAASCGI